MGKARQLDFKAQGKSLRQQMIIDSAVKIFHQKGYRRATLDDVAEDLGVTKPALYHYVSSKENLLSQIYIQALETFFGYIYEIPNMELSPAEKLRLFIRRHLNTVVIENLAMFSVFFSEESQLPEADFQRIREEKRKFTHVVETIIEDGISQGAFRPLNPKLQAYAIIGMCNWLYRWYKPDSSSFSPDEIADQFIALLEQGYRYPESEDRTALTKDAALRDQNNTLERKRNLFEELKQGAGQFSDLIEELEMLV
ncbi:MAG: TetR family transcriptional regulator [Deltaproteobacteria bacterium]|nr:TetR family transcriptional regulator [Deltaproteobacteria bacterium]